MKAIISVFAQFLFIFNISYTAQAQWVQTNGPIGGNITAIVMKDSLIFAGTYKSGIAVSPDKGKSWNLRNNGLPIQSLSGGASGQNVFALFVLNNTIYAAMYGSGVFRSMDNGLSWAPMNNGLKSMFVSAFTSIGDTIFASTNGGGVFFWVNEQSTWTPVNIGLTDLHDMWGCLIAKGGIIFTACEEGIFRSIDRGVSWTEANNGITSKYVSAFGIMGDIVWAGTEAKGVFFSTDNGLSWTSYNNDLHFDTSWLGVQFCFINSFATIGNNLFVGANPGLYSLSGNGSSWKSLSFGNGLPDTSVKALWVNGQNLLVGYRDTIFKTSDNGSTWTAISVPLKNIAIFALASSDKCLFAGSQGKGVFLSDDNGDSWTTINNGLIGRGLLINTIFPNHDTVFIGTYGAGVFLSKNNGALWEPVNSGLTRYGLNVNAITKFGSTIVIGTDSNGVYLSNDNGNSWKQKHINIPAFCSITALAVNSGIIFAGTGGFGVFRSGDSGKTWVIDTVGLKSKVITSLLIKDNYVFAGTNHEGIFRSEIDNPDWAAVNNGLWNTYVTSLTSKGDTIFLGTGSMSGSAFFSANNGESWNTMNEGMRRGYVCGLAVNDRFVFSGTLENSVWRAPLNDLVPSNSNTLAINHTQNIFITPGQLLKYTLSREGMASIAIYNLKGRIMYSKFNFAQSGGEYSLKLKDMNLPSGSYFIKMNIEGKNFHKFFTMIRR